MSALTRYDIRRCGTAVPRGQAPLACAVPLRAAWAALLPWVLLFVLVAVDVVLPIWLVIAPALAAVPALAAAVGRRARYPLLMGAVTLAASFIDAYRNHDILAPTHLATVNAVALTTVIGCLTGWARARQDRELARVRATADVAQQVLLRPVPEHLGPVRAAVDYTTAAAFARIGGDLYDVVLTRWGVRALIGDVQGKGLPAVATAAAVLGAFREAVHEEPAPDDVMRRIARSLSRSLPHDTEEFVTAALVCLPPAGGAHDSYIEVVNCGHPAPYLLRPDRPPQSLTPAHCVPPLGVLPATDVCPPVLRRRLRHGDAVLLYTDGITEARDKEGEFYPLAQRLPALATSDPRLLLRRLHTDVRAHTGGCLGDDAAALMLQYDG
ncbi:PP2C family protein-serine/threonine phosphatase [Streptomyces sp. NPDC090442]|uniref:PP2C family protein-serine/threonine phosphatase n=1 Tax=Streptomyces sp. NPDC090442 TaxID=3365962 RepID=UPI0038135DC6